MYKIYKITNLLNGKIYIGQTKNCVKRRFYEHCYHKSSIISKAIKKYGKTNFKMRVLKSNLSLKQANKYEIYYINKYKSKAPLGYNVTIGGLGKKGCPPWNKNLKGVIKAWNKGIYNRKASKQIISYNCNTKILFASSMAAVRKGFNSGHIIQCCKKKLKNHKGFTWRYANKGEIKLWQKNQQDFLYLSTSKNTKLQQK